MIFLFGLLPLLSFSFYCNWDNDGVIYNKENSEKCTWGNGFSLESNILYIDSGCPLTITLLNVKLPIYFGKFSQPNVTTLHIIKDNSWDNQIYYYFHQSLPSLQVYLKGNGFNSDDEKSFQFIVEVGTASLEIINEEPQTKFIQYNVYYSQKSNSYRHYITFKGLFDIQTGNGLYGGDGCRYLFSSFDGLQTYSSKNAYISNCGSEQRYYYCSGVYDINLPCICGTQPNNDTINSYDNCVTHHEYSVGDSSYSTIFIYLYLGPTFIHQVQRNWVTFNVFISPHHELKIMNITSKAFNIHGSILHDGFTDNFGFTSKDIINAKLHIKEIKQQTTFMCYLSTNIPSKDLYIKSLETVLLFNSIDNVGINSANSVYTLSPKNNCTSLFITIVTHHLAGMVKSGDFSCLIKKPTEHVK